jgi:hypothetical protein
LLVAYLGAKAGRSLPERGSWRVIRDASHAEPTWRDVGSISATTQTSRPGRSTAWNKRPDDHVAEVRHGGDGDDRRGCLEHSIDKPKFKTVGSGLEISSREPGGPWPIPVRLVTPGSCTFAPTHAYRPARGPWCGE